LYNKNIEYPNRVLDSDKIPSELQQDKEYLIEELQQDKENLIEELGAQISELYSVSDALDRVTSELSYDVSWDLHVIFDELGTVSQEYTSDALGSVLQKLYTDIYKLSDLSAEQLAILDKLCTATVKLY